MRPKSAQFGMCFEINARTLADTLRYKARKSLILNADTFEKSVRGHRVRTAHVRASLVRSTVLKNSGLNGRTLCPMVCPFHCGGHFPPSLEGEVRDVRREKRKE